MHLRHRRIVLLFGLLAACAGRPSVKPVESLDERTGITVTTLKESIELLPGAQFAALAEDKRTSFAYMGPVEWNRSGEFNYGLWVHIAPGSGAQIGDIHAAGALTLNLDDGAVALTPIEAPKLGRDPYRQVASWGQTAYFNLTIETLRRMAASRKLELDVRAADGSVIAFAPTVDVRAALNEYVQSRGLTGD
ncbi:MAG: hypothetical protein ABJD53_04970 [Gammaproteobacteria bacterium]